MINNKILWHYVTASIDLGQVINVGLLEYCKWRACIAMTLNLPGYVFFCNVQRVI